MDKHPFLDHCKGFRRKISFQYLTGHKVDGRNIVIVYGMNVRWIMLTLQENILIMIP